MKKVIALVLAIMLCFAVVGCDEQSVEEYNQQASEYNATIENKENSSSAEAKFTESKIDSDAETSSVITYTDKELMVMEFERIGLTHEEAIDAQKIFENVGITQIWDISKFIQGSGIDGEQGFYCNFYNFNVQRDSIRLDFEIVKRKLRTISISWARGKNYPEISKYHELKLLDGVKESDYGSYVFLYRKKLKNSAVDETSVGYKAIYNYETHTISKYT